MVLRAVKFIETQSRMEISNGWREGKMGNYCFMGPEFQFGKMKSVLHNNVIVLNIAERVHLKMVKMGNFMPCIFYHS